jgi:predicted alpha-1,2-mannosidase
MPFGMTLVGPDSRHSSYGALGAMHFGGYHYDDNQIDGFAHTHSHGMGVNDYGSVLVMPRARWRDSWTEDRERSAPFEHATEWASAGVYGVELLDDHTVVDIAATRHGAHHRYQFAAGAEPVVVFDLGHTLGDITIATARIDIDPSSGDLTGFQLLKGAYSRRFGGLQTHFVATFDPAPTSHGAWSDPTSPTPGAVDASGSSCGAWVGFPAGTEIVHVRVALSYVDVEGARANHDAETPDFDYDARVAEVREAWRAALGTVRVRGGTEAERRTFHTAGYHARLMPSLFVDVDGRYRGIDGEVHTADFDYYTDFSLWDTFRTQHPWLTLVDPDTQTDMLRSLVRMTQDGGSGPRWPLGHGYTGGMVGTPADQVFSGAYLKGITDGWDVEAAFAASVDHAYHPQADAGRGSVEQYVDLGFVSTQSEGGSASKTLEYAWSDHALADWAAALGSVEEAGLRDLSGNWANSWDPAVGFMHCRNEDGSFADFESDMDWDPSFVEGNAWHYVWYVPFDVDGMIEVQHGGDRAAFLTRLSDYWDEVYAEEDDFLPDDWYWHGNEPVMHYAALGSLAGDNRLTAESARWILANRYDDTVEGLDGNDDGGTLSAWYLFHAIGLYPVAGTATYALSSPIFERIEIDHPGGMTVIEAPGTSADRRYVNAVSLDGEPHSGWTIQHDQLRGSHLVFQMSAD